MLCVNLLLIKPHGVNECQSGREGLVNVMDMLINMNSHIRLANHYSSTQRVTYTCTSLWPWWGGAGPTENCKHSLTSGRRRHLKSPHEQEKGACGGRRRLELREHQATLQHSLTMANQSGGRVFIHWRFSGLDDHCGKCVFSEQLMFMLRMCSCLWIGHAHSLVSRLLHKP